METVDPIALWRSIRDEALQQAHARPEMARYFDTCVLGHATLGAALAALLGAEMKRIDAALPDFSDEFAATIAQRYIDASAAADVHRLASSNPACPNALTAFLSFRGIHAIQLHRVAHAYWTDGETTFAVLLQNWCAKSYNVDIHPAAKIGSGLFVDHAIGLVIGETAVVEDGVSMWHGVTLGSTFAEAGDRHPKIRRGATLAAHATILGNIEIGAGAVIAAGSVVRESVPLGMVAAGVPARVVKAAGTSYAAITAPANREDSR